jgi:hypothetical protein
MSQKRLTSYQKPGSVGIYIEHLPLKGRQDKWNGAWGVRLAVLLPYFHDKPRQPEVEQHRIGNFQQVDRALLVHVSLASLCPPILKDFHTPRCTLHSIGRNITLRDLSHLLQTLRLFKA